MDEGCACIHTRFVSTTKILDLYDRVTGRIHKQQTIFVVVDTSDSTASIVAIDENAVEAAKTADFLNSCIPNEVEKRIRAIAKGAVASQILKEYRKLRS